MAIIKQCSWCGKTISIPPSKSSKNNFCNRECYQAFHSKEVPICICEYCGKEFKGDKYNSNRYCSRECYNEMHKIKNKERKCPVCKKIFCAKSSKDIYCSWECYQTDRHLPPEQSHWKFRSQIIMREKDDIRHSTEYKQWRLDVYKRDHYQCIYCGSKEKINAHHKYSYKYYPDKRFDIDNGITVCEKCHIKLHQEFGYDTTELIAWDYKKTKGRS